MALANYTDLQAAIANWLEGRDDLTATIPDFIRAGDVLVVTRRGYFVGSLGKPDCERV